MSASIAGNHVLADNVSMARPMRQGPPAMTRPPNPGAAPVPVSVSGLGTGQAIGLRGGGDDSSQGEFILTVGAIPLGTGTIVVQWPVTPPGGTPFFAADSFSFVVTGANPYTLTWTALTPPRPGSNPRVQYQWLTST